jgi:hypothetical protein
MNNDNNTENEDPQEEGIESTPTNEGSAYCITCGWSGPKSAAPKHQHDNPGHQVDW